MEDLTRTAGIAKGTLYLYFRDKENLIQAVVEAGFEDLERQVRERVADAHSATGVVSRVVAAHMEFFAENPDLVRVFHQARGMLKFDRPRWRPLRLPLLLHLECIAKTLERSGALARLSPVRRYDLAIQLFGMVSGVSSVRIAAGRGGSVDADTRDVARAVVAAARTRPAPRRHGARLRPQRAKVPRQTQRRR